MGPVPPIGLWHQVACTRKSGSAVAQVPAHVVAVKVGRYHQLDGLAVHTFHTHIFQQPAVRGAYPGVHDNEPATGADRHRAEPGMDVAAGVQQFRVL